MKSETPITAHEYAEKMIFLSEEYSRYSGEVTKLLKAEADHYEKERPNCKSDTAVARAFSRTDEGIRKNTLEIKLKVIELQMRAIKTFIYNATQEALGHY